MISPIYMLFISYMPNPKPVKIILKSPTKLKSEDDPTQTCYFNPRFMYINPHKE